jgi:hypothetical protein
MLLGELFLIYGHILITLEKFNFDENPTVHRTPNGYFSLLFQDVSCNIAHNLRNG